MKKRIAVIGAALSLMPLGQPLVIGAGAALTTAAVMLSVPETALAESAFDSAYKKAEEGDHYGAISDYNQSLKIDPGNYFAYYNRGLSKNALKDYYGAISDFNNAIKFNSTYAEFFVDRGLSKRAIKDYQGALFDYTKGIEINPKYRIAYYNRGNLKLVNLDDPYGAIADYTRSLDIDPGHFKSFTNRGIAKEKIGDVKGACDDWRKASSLGDEDAAQVVKADC